MAPPAPNYYGQHGVARSVAPESVGVAHAEPAGNLHAWSGGVWRHAVVSKRDADADMPHGVGAGRGRPVGSLGGVSWGSLKAEPKRCRLLGKQEAPPAFKTEPNGGLDSAPPAVATADDDGSDADLDDFAKAAIVALRNRDRVKTETAKASKKAATAAALGTAAKATPNVTVVKKASVAVVKKERRKGRPPSRLSAAVAISGGTKMPVGKTGEKMAPCSYKTGRIYWSFNQMCFRVIRQVPHYKTELKVKWKGKKPTGSAWKQAITAIDVYKPKKL